MNNAIGADYNAAKNKVTGGHSTLNGDVKVMEVVSAPGVNEVYEASVSMKAPDGTWIDKMLAPTPI